MIYRIFPEKDTWITNVQRNSTQRTGSNFGASEILDLFKRSAVSGASGLQATASLSRLLMKFDLSEFAALTASGRAPMSGASYFLRLYDAHHKETVPTSYDVVFYPLSRSWDEGRGIDNDTYLDLGVANWNQATSNTAWSTPGGDFVTSSSGSYHFDTGLEDVCIDVSNIVGAWMTGNLPNHGFLVKLTSDEESDAQYNDYYIKKFHARNTYFKDRRPTLEMRFDDSLKDDRDNFVFGATNVLFLYNRVKGALTNISGVGTGQNVLAVRIFDASGTLATASASHVGRTGIYSASFNLSTGSYSGSIFYDAWHLNGVSYMTCSFYPRTDGSFCNTGGERYIVTVKNKKKEYEKNELVRFKLFVKTNNYGPAVVSTGSLSLDNTIITKAYYRIDNALTNQVVIPLGTGSLETTRLSYDSSGNYFDLYMSSLSEGEVYKIVLFFDVDGELQKIDRDFKFRVIG